MVRVNKQRKTVRHFLGMITKGDLLEILKVLRRRFLNTVKFLRILAYKIFGVAYYHPTLVYRRNRKQLRRVMREYYGQQPIDENDTRIKIAVILNRGDSWPSSSAFIRLIAPLSNKLAQDKFSFKLYPENTTTLDENTKVCIVQRTAVDNLDAAKQLLKNVADQGIRLIVDTDDAFASIDKSHPEYDSHFGTLEAKELLLKKADKIWVSTEILKKTFSPSLQKKIVVIENTKDTRFWKDLNKLSVSKKRLVGKPLKIVYMGTATHDSDFEMILPVFKKLAKLHPKSFKLTIIGVALETPDYDWLTRSSPKTSLYPIFSSWFDKVAVKYDIGLSPLVDSPFNRCKSDIKALDYLASGIVPLVSDIEPYEDSSLDGLIIRVKNTPGEWDRVLKEIILDRDRFRIDSAKTISQARSYIERERSTKAAARAIEKELSKLI